MNISLSVELGVISYNKFMVRFSGNGKKQSSLQHINEDVSWSLAYYAIQHTNHS